MKSLLGTSTVIVLKGAVVRTPLQPLPSQVSLLAHAESAFSVLTAAASKVPAWLCLGRILWRKGMPDVQQQYSTTEERNQERDTEYAKKGDPG